MAKQKKSVRRVPRSATPRTFGDGQPAPLAPAETAEAVAPRMNGNSATSVRPVASGFRRRPSIGSESRPQLPLSEEYGYVVKDLTRLSILAGGMVVLMVVLGIIIH